MEKLTVVEMGKRFKKVRTVKGLTQLEFSDLLETTQKHISNYENGIFKIPNRVTIKLHEMGVDIIWLLTGKGTVFITLDSEKLLKDIKQRDKEIKEWERKYYKERDIVKNLTDNVLKSYEQNAQLVAAYIEQIKELNELKKEMKKLQINLRKNA